MNIRMLPPAAVQKQTMTINGRAYTAAAGSFLDVADFDAGGLNANGWISVAPSGPTSARLTGALGPYAAAPGVRYFDTTINALIIYDGATWRSPVDGSSV